MIRRAASALAVCAAVLAVGAQAAAADVVNRQVYRCEYDARWQLRFVPPTTWYADMTYDTGAATGTGCKKVQAVVYDDLDFRAFQTDHGQADTITFRLSGVFTSEGGFAGTAQRVDAPASGPLVAANGLLNAEITYLDPQGMQAVNVHRGTGSCGTWCFETRSAVSVATF